MTTPETSLVEVVDHLIKSRRTVRDFVSDSIDDSTLRELIEAAIWAPNHRMTGPWRFFVLKKGGGSRSRMDTIKHPQP